TIRVVDQLTAVAAEIVSFSKDSAVVVSGAGTSGRIAFQVVVCFNAVLRRYGLPPCFHFLIAGGLPALLKAQEGAEDNQEAAAAALRRVEARGNPWGKPCGRVLYIGISCGLSAPYVAAQVKYALSQSHYAVAVMGFNPPSLAPNTKGAPGVTFPSVLQELRARIDAAEAEGEVARHFILSPAVGPETITGSTRLKGGTATKILLETIFSRAIARVLRLPALGSYAGVPLLLINPPPELTPDDKTAVRRAARVGWGRTEAAPAARYGDVMAAYEGAMRGVYQQLPGIVALTRLFHHSISTGGRVMYIGDDSLGLVGLIDASEQVPTFGARPGSFQGFFVPPASFLSSHLPISLPPAPSPPPQTPQNRASEGNQHRPLSARGPPHHTSHTCYSHSCSLSLSSPLTRLSSLVVFPFLLPLSSRALFPTRSPSCAASSANDTVLLLESHVLQPQLFPLPLLTALHARAKQGLLSLALLSVGVAPHDRLLMVYDDEDGVEEGKEREEESEGEGSEVEGSEEEEGEEGEEGREEDEEGEEEGGEHAEGGAEAQGEEREEKVGEVEEDEEEERGSSDSGVLVGRELGEEERLAVDKEREGKSGDGNEEGDEEGSEEGSEWESVDGDETEHLLHSSATGQACESTQKPPGDAAAAAAAEAEAKAEAVAAATTALAEAKAGAGVDAETEAAAGDTGIRKRRPKPMDSASALFSDIPFSSFPSSLSSSSTSSPMASYFSSPSPHPLNPTFLQVSISLPAPSAAPLLPRTDLFAQLAVKLALNVASSGAHVLLGKVYSNRMVDLRVSNEKLFKRAVRVVGELAGVGEEEAERCVRRAIVIAEREEGMEGRAGREGRVKGEVGDDQGDCMRRTVEEMVRVGAKMERIVPTAILLAAGCFDDEEGTRDATLSNRSVRMLVVDALKRKT
ncbi:unnamed protein product, partial [Closterium sp. Naga37s-1]